MVKHLFWTVHWSQQCWMRYICSPTASLTSPSSHLTASISPLTVIEIHYWIIHQVNFIFWQDLLLKRVIEPVFNGKMDVCKKSVSKLWIICEDLQVVSHWHQSQYLLTELITSGHAVVAKTLWNNIMQPVGAKDKTANLTDLSQPLACPDKVRRIFFSLSAFRDHFFRHWLGKWMTRFLTLLLQRP